jgi:hypothetical protein
MLSEQEAQRSVFHQEGVQMTLESVVRNVWKDGGT